MANLVLYEKEKLLTDLYFIIRNVPAWITDCREAGFPETDLNYLESLDTEYGLSTSGCWGGNPVSGRSLPSYQPEREAEAWRQEVLEKGGEAVELAENDQKSLDEINAYIYRNALRIESWRGIKARELEFVLLRQETERLAKLRKRIEGRLWFKNRPVGEITNRKNWQELIDKARKYPLELLLKDHLERGRMPCPFHKGEDKNFLVKDGFGYCFVCNKRCDSIQYLIEVELRSFKEAVSILAKL